MPGAYAHITLVNLAIEPHQLKSTGIPPAVKLALGKYKHFAELGAVSPDYPYLDVLAGQAAKVWADNMHYVRTGRMIESGLRQVALWQAESRYEKCLAWLWGYAAHIVADLTIHPIVERRVGPYEENAAAHRTCEMHQDVYIFQRLHLGPLGISEHLDSGLGRCSGATKDLLDADIADLWITMLGEVYPSDSRENPPNPNRWHAGFNAVVDAVEEGDKLFPWARHVAANKGLVYPANDDIDESYIRGLGTPEEGTIDYDTLFDRAVANVLQMWKDMSAGLDDVQAPLYAKLGNWNLDTGRDEQGRYVYWRANV